MRTLIGIITGTRRDKYEDQIAWIRPLAEATNDSWEADLAPESEFPSRGSIFWPRAAEVTRLEKTLNSELDEWVNLARRSIA